MKKHFVNFYTPGTFFSEFIIKEISFWNIVEAVEMARSIKDDYGVVPYGFRFITRGREDQDLDSKVIAQSGMYFLGGKVETLKEVIARDDPNERILRSNMQNNGYTRIITNTNSWKVTQPFEDGDIVLQWP